MGVPARQAGWMSRHGYRLGAADAHGVMTCPYSGLKYRQHGDGRLVCLDVEENVPLPKTSDAA
jgi:UDP-2-acetamido-3-amino-2,3-dideoxy-glucuronate N-acetyltransferase